MQDQVQHLRIKVKRDSALARAAQFLKDRLPLQDFVLKLTVNPNDGINCRFVNGAAARGGKGPRPPRGKADILRTKLIDTFLTRRRYFAKIRQNCVVPEPEIEQLRADIKEQLLNIYKVQGSVRDDEYLNTEIDQIMSLAVAFPCRPSIDVSRHPFRMNG